VGVFLLDDLQVVRPEEIGRSAFIREHAERMGCVVHGMKLQTQFRCAGSEAFISWVDHMLHVGITAHPEWVPDPQFDFRIFPDPQSMEDAIRAKVADSATGRMMAGYCWPWSEKPLPDGSLAEDVVIGAYRRPWNARPESTALKPGIPKSHYWAYEPGGIDQVGCMYTAQGFEFDYACIIIGKDMVYDFATNAWKGQPEDCYDGLVKGSRKFLDLVKNTYRVLLTLVQKGCYVCFKTSAGTPEERRDPAGRGVPQGPSCVGRPCGCLDASLAHLEDAFGAVGPIEEHDPELVVHQLGNRPKLQEKAASSFDLLEVVRALIIEDVAGDDQLHPHTNALALQQLLKEGGVREPGHRRMDDAACLRESQQERGLPVIHAGEVGCYPNHSKCYSY
jgi:DUF2075 family protein